MIGRPIPTVQESGIFRVFRDANSLQNDVIPEDYEPDDEEKRVQFRLWSISVSHKPNQESYKKIGIVFVLIYFKDNASWLAF